MNTGRAAAQELGDARPEPGAAARRRDHQRAADAEPRSFFADARDGAGAEHHALGRRVMDEGGEHRQSVLGATQADLVLRDAALTRGSSG